MTNPKVSIICLCHNQAPFVLETLMSAINQTYTNIEIIIVDDGSKDGSKNIVSDFVKNYPSTRFIDLPENLGNCKAFNEGFYASSGEFIIDLSCDDVLLPNRVEIQVAQFADLDKSYGVVFSNAQYIDEGGRKLQNHFQNGKVVLKGDLYLPLIDTYFVAAPTMMIRRKVLRDMGGYDSELSYEDFDFWIRSSRNYHYGYSDQVLTLIRQSPKSKSSGFYKKNDVMVYSTLSVCKKIQDLNRSEEEDIALIRRVRYEIKHAALNGNFGATSKFLEFLNALTDPNFVDKGYFLFSQLRLDLSFLIHLKRKLL